MKALTIQQPYAMLIALGDKRVENRSWQTSYRGPLAIHAGMRVDTEFTKEIAEECQREGWYWPDPLPRGGIIAVAQLYDIVADAESIADPDDREWFGGPLGWLLADAQLVEFVPMRGRLGLWDVDDALIKPIPFPDGE
jgi:hypothetical protein